MANDVAEALHDGYRAFQRGDLAALAPLFAQDIRWHNFGASPFSGVHVGRDVVFELFGRVADRTDSYQQQVHDLLVSDDHAVALIESTAIVDGDTFTGRAVHIMHVTGGVITEAWIQPVDHKHYERFWADHS